MKQNTVAVVYLARHAEGLRPVRNFVESWKRHPPGMPCKLVVIWKGFPDDNPDGSPQARALSELPHQSLSIPDTGFDLSAYRFAARERPEDFLVFLNTFSTIESHGWVKKLYGHAGRTGVGMVSATASFESIPHSMKSMSRSVWLAIHDIPFDQVMADQWGPEILKHAPDWLCHDHPFKRVRGSLYRSAKRVATSLLKKEIPRVLTDRCAIEAAFEETWDNIGRVYDAFPSFPNPHLRSNAFMIRRKLFLELSPKSFPTKEAAFLAESGSDSFTRQIYRRGLECLVVGNNARGFDADSWYDSFTFRRGLQVNKLVADNQTRAWDSMNTAQKSLYENWTWGPVTENRMPAIDHLSRPVDRPGIVSRLPNQPLC